MSKPALILLIILIIALIIVLVLYLLGRRARKKQDEQQAQIEASKQTISMLVIDKKRMPVMKSGLPQVVIDNTPFLLRRSKIPVVKAKVGPRIMQLIADEKIFDDIPVKKEVKAQVSGIYIVDVKGIRKNGGDTTPQKGFRARLNRLRTNLAKKAAG